jgi:hypothetical protein
MHRTAEKFSVPLSRTPAGHSFPPPMQAAAVSVNGVDLPLLHPLWLAAVQSL